MVGQTLRIIWDNRAFDQAVLTASSEVATMGVENLQDKVRSRPWRTTGIADEWMAADFGEAVYCTCLALLNHNFTYSAQLTVQTSATPDFGVVEEQPFPLIYLCADRPLRKNFHPVPGQPGTAVPHLLNNFSGWEGKY